MVITGTSLRVLGMIYRTVFVSGQEGTTTLTGASPSDPRLTRAILSVVLKYVDSSRDTDRLSAMQAICSFAGASSEGLRLVIEDPVLLRTWLDIRAMTTEMKAASLRSIARVLKDQPGKEVGEADRAVSLDLKRLLFTRLGEMNNATTTMVFLMNHLRQPIPTTRHAVFDIMTGVASQPTGWGLRLLWGFSGFREFILDRRTETSKEGKEWKFAIIESTMQCDSKSIMGEDFLEELQDYLRKGPFYAPRVEAEVDTGEMS